jgi:hypothetical protein
MLLQTGDMPKSQPAPGLNHQTASPTAVMSLAHPPLQTTQHRVSRAPKPLRDHDARSCAVGPVSRRDLPAQSANAVALRTRSTLTNGQSPDNERYRKINVEGSAGHTPTRSPRRVHLAVLTVPELCGPGSSAVTVSLGSQTKPGPPLQRWSLGNGYRRRPRSSKRFRLRP